MVLCVPVGDNFVQFRCGEFIEHKVCEHDIVPESVEATLCILRGVLRDTASLWSEES